MLIHNKILEPEMGEKFLNILTTECAFRKMEEKQDTNYTTLISTEKQDKIYHSYEYILKIF